MSTNLPSAATYDPAVAGNTGVPKPDDAKVLHAFGAAGKCLADFHVGYEQQAEYPLHCGENSNVPLSWRAEKMRRSNDKSALAYSEFLTLGGIPPETFDYRLGNPDRSGLEWVIDQYQVSTDKRSGITNDRKTKSTPHPDPLPVRGGEGKDPNRPDDPEYIVRLLGQSSR